MIDLVMSLLHFCASCVSDNNVIPPALGALGGAAGAAGGLGGLRGLGGGAGDGGPGGGTGGGPSGHGANAAPVSRPQPIGDTPPANGPTPIGDQGAAPDLPSGWGVGNNPDGGQTLTYGGTRTTFEPGGGPVPIDDNLPGNVSDPQPIGDTPPANGPTPIGDQGAAPDLPSGWGVGNNPDGGQTLTYGGTRTTFEPGGGPAPIDDNLPGNVSDPQHIGEASPSEQPPSSDTQPTGDSTPAPGTQPSGASPPGSDPPPGSTPTTITTPDGTVTTVQPDGSTNVASTLPPSGSGLTTGPGATDPNDPQQGQQPIGFTHQVLGSSSPSDPTSTISDMPNTAHVQGTPTPGTTQPGTTPTGTTPHKPNTP